MIATGEFVLLQYSFRGSWCHIRDRPCAHLTGNAWATCTARLPLAWMLSPGHGQRTEEERMGKVSPSASTNRSLSEHVEKKRKRQRRKERVTKKQLKKEKSHRDREKERDFQRLTGSKHFLVNSSPIWLAGSCGLFPWLQLLCNCFLQLTDFIYFACSSPFINLLFAKPSERPTPWLETLAHCTSLQTISTWSSEIYVNKHTYLYSIYLDINVYIYTYRM